MMTRFVCVSKLVRTQQQQQQQQQQDGDSRCGRSCGIRAAREKFVNENVFREIGSNAADVRVDSQKKAKEKEAKAVSRIGETQSVMTSSLRCRCDTCG